LDYQTLIRKCLEGNSRAQKELFDHFSGKMYYVCLRYACDQVEAQDMLQEGFIRLFTNLDSFKGKGSFEGWARRIFVHTAIKYYHRMRKHNGNVTIDHAYAHDVRATAISELGEKELLGLVQSLPNGYRVVFNMYAIEGFSHKEIAETLGIKESTSRSQLVKARNMLQNQVVDLQKILI
jgi:RNA polymerase sigma factor (sigma-70 family)